MISVRSLLICLLCGLASFGHVPAWLHLSGCDHETHQATNVVAETSCCCAHDAVDDSDESPAVPHSEHHDSETCVICQSLVAPTGVTWQIEAHLSSEICVDLSQIPAILILKSTFCSIPQPRGPPVCA